MPELLDSVSSFNRIINGSHLTVVHFCADWVEQCAQVNDVLDTLSQQKEYSKVKFCKCQAEDLHEASLKCQIEAVPTVVFFQNGKVIDRVNGVDPAQLTDKVKQYSQLSSEDRENDSNLEERLKTLINKHNVMLFMKGDRSNPRCGFSKQIVSILNECSVDYDTFDILTDEEVRQGLKAFSDWPTYPQLYVRGELIGGLDIVKEMQAAGELIPTLKS